MPNQKKPVSLAEAPVVRDTGPAKVELVRQATGFTEFKRIADGAPVVVHAKGTRVLTEPLDRYLHREQITNDQWSSGERLRRMHDVAFGSGFHSVNLDGFHGVTNYADNWRIGNDQSEALHDYKRLAAGFSAREWAMLEGVCCHGQWAKHLAQRCGVRPRQGIDLLRACLKQLDQHFRKGRGTAKPVDGRNGRA